MYQRLPGRGMILAPGIIMIVFAVIGGIIAIPLGLVMIGLFAGSGAGIAILFVGVVWELALGIVACAGCNSRGASVALIFMASVSILFGLISAFAALGPFGLIGLVLSILPILILIGAIRNARYDGDAGYISPPTAPYAQQITGRVINCTACGKRFMWYHSGCACVHCGAVHLSQQEAALREAIEQCKSNIRTVQKNPSNTPGLDTARIKANVDEIARLELELNRQSR